MERRRFIGATTLGVAAFAVPGMVRAKPLGGSTLPQDGTLYVNPVTGDDGEAGTRSAPLRTLPEAARRVSRSSGTGPLAVVLSEGIHAIGETALFKPERGRFTRTDRLTIRAEVLPDDDSWHHGRMPTLIHTLPLKDT